MDSLTSKVALEAKVKVAQTAEVQNDAYVGFQGPSGKGNKGDKGKGKGKGKSKGGDGPKGVCYKMRDTGVCEFGGECRFSHDPKDTGRTQTGALTKEAVAAGRWDPPPPPQKQQNQDGQPDQQGGFKGKGKGKAKGKNGKGGKGDPKQQQPAGKNKKTVLCKYYKYPDSGRCDKGKACPYSHDKRSFDSNFKFVGKAKNRQGGQDAADAGGWDEPVGLSSGGPQIVITNGLIGRGAAAADNQSRPVMPRKQEERKAQREQAAARTGASVAVAPEAVTHDTGKQGKPALKNLADLFAKCWTLAEQDTSGIQYYTGARVHCPHTASCLTVGRE